MKRGPKPSPNGNRNEGDSKLVKKTFLFDQNMHQHLAVAALVVGKEQAEIVREAVSDRLRDMGCDLTKPPQLPKIRDVSGS